MSYISKIGFFNGNWENNETDLIVVGVYKDKSLTDLAKKISDQHNGIFSDAISVGDVSGEVGEFNFFYVDGMRILLLGLGPKKEFGSETMRLVAGHASRIAIQKKIPSFTIESPSSKNNFNKALGEGIVLGSYQFLGYKTKKNISFELESVMVFGSEQKDSIKIGTSNAVAVCFARDLGNFPANIATPSKLESFAREIASDGEMTITVMDREEFTRMGMGGLAGVAQGTDEPPKFIVLEYMKGGKEKPKVLVGKGLTFDSGGISIKPAAKMDEMKYDMCGGALVLGVFKGLSLLNPEINVVGIIPSTENLSGSKAYKPGDVLTAYNGKTIEVLNTDAEGRLILADGLSYASKHYEPKYILDFATLTGAVLVALGHVATGIMGTDKELINQVFEASKDTDEKVWELPLWSEYCNQIKSDIADVKNMGAPMQAGTIAAGAFLKEFVDKKIPWVHFDIAGTAWGAKPSSINPKGSATGWGVRLVLEMLNS